MRNTSIVRTTLVMAVCAFLTVSAYAQPQQGQRAQRGEGGMGMGGQMDPARMEEMRAQMLERQLERFFEASNTATDEQVVLKPLVEGVINARNEANMGRMGGMMGGRQGGQGGGARMGGAEPTAAQQKAQTALESGEGLAEAIKALEEERAAQQKKVDEAVKALKEVAPLRLQLAMMMQGLL